MLCYIYRSIHIYIWYIYILIVFVQECATSSWFPADQLKFQLSVMGFHSLSITTLTLGRLCCCSYWGGGGRGGGGCGGGGLVGLGWWWWVGPVAWSDSGSGSAENPGFSARAVGWLCPWVVTVFGKANKTWWRHQMETFFALLAICAGNSPVPGEFPTQRPVTRSFDVYFDLRRINGWVNNR